MNNLKDFLIGLAVGVVVGVGLMFMVTPARAETNCQENCVSSHQEFHCDFYWGRCWFGHNETVCDETELVCPVATPVPTCNNGAVGVDGHECGYSPTFPHDEKYNPQVCTGDLPKAPILAVTKLSDTSFKANWWPVDGVDHYSLLYGYKSENEMGVPNLVAQATEKVVDGLQANSTLFVRLMAEKGDKCASWSNVVSVNLGK